MPKSKPRAYSGGTKLALNLMAKLIRSERLKQNISARELAERAGIARSTLVRIEKADPKCEIGVIFEIATLLHIPLFNPSQSALKSELAHLDETLHLLPGRTHPESDEQEVDDDF